MANEKSPAPAPAPQQQGRALPAVIQERKSALVAAITENISVIETLAPAEQEKFRQNMLDFAFQDYLMRVIAPRDLIEFAVKVTRIGLDISPAAKECYIVPFDTKVEGVKVMLPQVIIPLSGIQELAYQKGFQLLVHNVYEIDGEVFSEDGMPMKYLRQINTASEEWVNQHFVGFKVVLTDLTPEQLPQQCKLVEVAYAREVTKTVQDKRHQIQNWIHKACRRAFRDFFIPNKRKITAFDAVEALNDEVLSSNKADTNIREPKNFEELHAALAPLGISLKYAGNGMSHANGEVYSNSKTLLNLGFSYSGNVYAVETTEPASAAVADRAVAISPEIEKALNSLGLEVEVSEDGHGVAWAKATGNTTGLDQALGEMGFKSTSKGWVGKAAGLRMPQQALFT